MTIFNINYFKSTFLTCSVYFYRKPFLLFVIYMLHKQQNPSHRPVSLFPTPQHPPGLRGSLCLRSEWKSFPNDKNPCSVCTEAVLQLCCCGSKRQLTCSYHTLWCILNLNLFRDWFHVTFLFGIMTWMLTGMAETGNYGNETYTQGNIILKAVTTFQTNIAFKLASDLM